MGEQALSVQGAELAGRYRLAEKIGEGGMGSVWVARDERPEGDAPRDVAVKVLHKTLVHDTAAIARFRHEASVASGIAHPNLCRVLDVGEADGSPYLVMEHLRGENLGERLTRERTLNPTVAVEIVLQVLAGLAAAHEKGVLHRDLKPENVFLAKENGAFVAKILDFGVSKFIGDDSERVKLTRTGALVGTPAYMSPEQVLGVHDIDVRSDVWAVGVLLYEALAGELPYEAPNYNAMLVKIATAPPRPIRAVLPALDPGLCTIVDRALAPNRAERFESAGELADALRTWLAGDPVHLKAPRVAMPTPITTTTPMSWAEQAPGEERPVTVDTRPRRQGTGRWLLPTVLTVVLGSAGIAIAIGVRRSGAEAIVPGARANTRSEANSSLLPPPVPAAVETNNEFRLSVSGVPSGAQVRVNGRDATLPAIVHRGESARIEITADGFDPWSQTIAPTGDVTLTFEPHRTVPPIADPRNVADSGLPAGERDHAGRGTSRRNANGRNARPRLEGGVAPHPDF